jgi:hypothetical protein
VSNSPSPQLRSGRGDLPTTSYVLVCLTTSYTTFRPGEEPSVIDVMVTRHKMLCILCLFPLIY